AGGVEHRVFGVLVGAVAVEEQRSALFIPIPPIYERYGDSRPVRGGGPHTLGGVVVAVVSAAYRLLLDDRSLARLHVVVDGRPRGGQRGVEEPHHLAVVAGAAARESRVGGVRLIDHVELAGRRAQNLDPLQAIRPLAEDDVTPVHVDEVEPHARTLRHNLGPRRAGRAGYGRGH